MYLSQRDQSRGIEVQKRNKELWETECWNGKVEIRTARWKVRESAEKCGTRDREIVWRSEIGNTISGSEMTGRWDISRKVHSPDCRSPLKIVYTPRGVVLWSTTATAGAFKVPVLRLHYHESVGCVKSTRPSSVLIELLAEHHHTLSRTLNLSS